VGVLCRNDDEAPVRGEAIVESKVIGVNASALKESSRQRLTNRRNDSNGNLNGFVKDVDRSLRSLVVPGRC
jgi:hypothetical protein